MAGLRLNIDLALGPRAAEDEEEAFAPTALFGASEAGVWYDPSDLSSMFQDSAGTTPAAVDSPVGRINDKSGNGNNAVQATAAARPILRAGGYLEFDGVDDFLRSTFAIAQPWDRISALRQISWTGTDRIYNGVAGFSGALYQRTASPNLAIYDGGTPVEITGPAIGANGIITERHDGANSRVALNNGTYGTGSTGTTAAGGVTIGATDTGTLTGAFRYYGMVMIGRDLSDSEISALRSYLAAKAGVTL